MGQIVLVGAPSEPLELPAYAIVPGGKGVVGNCVGGIRDCQAMLDFAGKHGITADVEQGRAAGSRSRPCRLTACLLALNEGTANWVVRRRSPGRRHGGSHTRSSPQFICKVVLPSKVFDQNWI
jgi:hypothetical protein